ncbi:MAG: hypothetical protein HY052_09650 [Proteobacteria bacterium]|nr:hypothetical protein [Pseudomonadota bacterium]
MTGVTLTAAMRANLASLQGTAMLMGNTQLRLSTGLKVNSALDNPTSFFAAQGLNNRASDLSALLDGMAQSIQGLKATSQGIDGLTALVNQAKAITQTAQAQPATGGSTTGTVSLTPLTMSNLTTALVSAGDQIGISVNGAAAVNITIAANDTITTFINNINGAVGLQNADSSQQVKAELVADPATAGNYFLKLSTTGGQTLTLTNVTGTPRTAFGLASGVLGSSADISTQITQYATLMTQINQFITDTGYKGTNYLNGDSKTIQLNEGNTSSLTITGTRRDVAGLGMSAAMTLATLSTVASNIGAAQTTLRNDASNYGNNLAVLQARSDFTTNLVGSLKDGANQLIVADKNEEGANMLALQTAQQLGIQALSLASQANQSVLRLFA